MRTERVLTKKSVANICALLITSAAIIQPFRNMTNTVRVIEALRGNDIGCIDGAESRDKNYPFDTIAVPGAGIIEVSKEFYVPSEPGQMRLKAAAMAYIGGFAPTITLLDGTVHQGEESVDIDYLQKVYRELARSKTPIPREKIFIEHASINTATNMSELAKIVQTQRMQRVLIVTNAFHGDRAVVFACNFGVAATSLSAEQIILNQDPLAARAVLQMYESQTFIDIDTKERIELALAVFDPEGYIPTWIRQAEISLRKK